MDNKTYRALLEIINYLSEEEKHWEEMGKPRKHIYHAVQQLATHADEIAKEYKLLNNSYGW